MAVGDGTSLFIGAVESGNTANVGSHLLILHGAADLAVFDDTAVLPANATHIVIALLTRRATFHIRVDIEMTNGAFAGYFFEEAGIASVCDTVAVTVEIA